MINELANFLNNQTQYDDMHCFIIILGILIMFIGSFIGISYKSNVGIVAMLGTFIIGGCSVCLSNKITEHFVSGKLQAEINSKMQAIDNEYPYQLSIDDSNNNVYFVFCKTKNSQNKVIKTMNTENNPVIKVSDEDETATYINVSQHIENGISVEKQIKEKNLLDFVENKSNIL